MREEIDARTVMLLGEAAVRRLKRSRVAVFGIGGVGGHCAEALARCGVGQLDLIDADTVSLSNLNRQLIATLDTVGQSKVQVMQERISRIAPDCRVTCHNLFYLPDTADAIDLALYDYVVDAVDTVTAKLTLAERCYRLGVPLISAMGTGNKLDPTKLKVTDIYATDTCPLARIMRKELRRRDIPALKVVYSTEEAALPLGEDGKPSRTPGSVSFVPGAAGLILASEVVRALIHKEETSC